MWAISEKVKVKNRIFTREVPWLDLVDVDDGDGVEAEGLPGDLALQIVPNQFFIRRVESESGSE